MNDDHVHISNPDKILFRDKNMTKKDVINYYKKIASHILPLIKDRPIMIQRFPEGIEADGFVMKNKPDYFPDWIETIRIEKKEGGYLKQILCNDLATLKYLVNQGTITLHSWLSEKSNLKAPNQMIFDLDPSTNNLAKVKKAAFVIKEILDHHHLVSYVMTTGSKGLHIVVPIQAKYTLNQVNDLALYLAKNAIEHAPKLLTIEQRKNARGKKVFVDTLRNAYGQTSVVPYALRPVKEASVATPLNWDELKKKQFNPKAYTIKNIFRRLGHVNDVWHDFQETFNDLHFLINKIES